MVIEEDDWSDYDTGPFCGHWSYAYDCDRVCATCGKECREHGESGDECPQWKETPE